jgi:hypothetical protein
MKGSQPGLKAINKALGKLRQLEIKLSDLNARFNVGNLLFPSCFLILDLLIENV